MLDNLKVKVNDEKELLYPLKDIHTIILDNYKLVVSIQLLNKCADNNINLVCCGVDHNPCSILIPHSGHHAMALELKKQIGWTEDKKALAHQSIIQRKIKNQYLLLGKLNLIENTKAYLLNNYVDEVKISDSTNREGLAAKVYFKILYGDKFIRFDDDPLNAALNYGYAILRSQINKVVVAKGLNASLGIIHKGPLNSFNLSDDIIEVYRPIVDKWVYENMRYATDFTKEHRIELIKLTTGNVDIQNQEQTLLNSMVIYTNSIISFFENEDPIIFPDFDGVYEL